MNEYNTPFQITSLCRADLISQGFDGDNVSDETMKSIANKMADAYVEDRFWSDLDFYADQFGIKRVDKPAV